VVDLGSQPASDDFPPIGAPEPDARWPLELWWCPKCALVQLGPIEALLEEPVRAVESQSSRQHAGRVAAALLADRPELAGASVREFAERCHYEEGHATQVRRLALRLFDSVGERIGCVPEDRATLADAALLLDLLRKHRDQLRPVVGIHDPRLPAAGHRRHETASVARDQPR
jgi:hypothetical protein